MAELRVTETGAAAAEPRAGRVAAGAMRALIFTHRYVGVVLGLLMLLWCLSGFVMLYQSFPDLSSAERLQGLAPLKLDGCCDASKIDLADDTTLASARLEMLAGEPVLRIGAGFGPSRVYRLPGGAPVDDISPAQVSAVARDFAAGLRIDGPPRPPQQIDRDQWTVAAADRNQPVYKVRFDDSAGTDIYVSGATGQVFQQTTRAERWLSWIGAVPHWLYPTLLRQNPPLWSQVVIWTSTVGVFLTVMGLWIGVVRFRRRRNGRWSPYRGVMWQHHVPGLVFGVLTLTWVFSGLMTMGPWGLLEPTSGPLRRDFVGETTWGAVKPMLAQAPSMAGPGAVQLELVTLGGRPSILAVGNGPARRLDVQGQAAPVTPADILAAAAGTKAPVRDLTLLTREDSYYYAHHQTVTLPVYRLSFGDAGGTQLYVDPTSGKVLRAVDAARRTNRWVETGLHDLDFAWLRPRPLWDIVVLTLLAGVTFVCGTGVWLGVRRIRLDLARVRQPRPETRQPG